MPGRHGTRRSLVGDYPSSSGYPSSVISIVASANSATAYTASVVVTLVSGPSISSVSFSSSTNFVSQSGSFPNYVVTFSNAANQTVNAAATNIAGGTGSASASVTVPWTIMQQPGLVSGNSIAYLRANGYLFQDSAHTVPAVNVGDPVYGFTDPVTGLVFSASNTTTGRPLLSQDASGYWYLPISLAFESTATVSVGSSDHLTLVYSGSATNSGFFSVNPRPASSGQARSIAIFTTNGWYFYGDNADALFNTRPTTGNYYHICQITPSTSINWNVSGVIYSGNTNGNLTSFTNGPVSLMPNNSPGNVYGFAVINTGTNALGSTNAALCAAWAANLY